MKVGWAAAVWHIIIRFAWHLLIAGVVLLAVAVLLVVCGAAQVYRPA